MKESFPVIDRPEYIDSILPYLDKPFIKVLTGMRRVGKSSIIKLLIKHLVATGVSRDQILYINMESLKWERISSYKELYSEVKDFKRRFPNDLKIYLFIDEVQEIDQWEKAINSFLSDEIADIVITGSNSRLLSSELAGYLSGRYIEFPIFPLSFSEFLTFKKASGINILSNNQDEFKLYLRYGGMPGIHFLNMNDATVFPYLNALYSSIVLKDVINRHQIRDPQILERIIRFVFDNCGNITSSKRITNFFQNEKISVTVNKVLNYLRHLEQAFLIQKVDRFDIKGLKVLEFYEKIYVGDIGLRHGFLGYQDNDISGLLENIVYQELLRRGYDVKIGKIDHQEIDFIAENNQGRVYIQVTLTLSNESTIEREFKSLEMVRDHHKKIVLTLDEFQSIERKGITSQNLINFLLEK